MFQTLPEQPADGILKLMKMFRDDPRSDKIDLGVGVYRNAEGVTPIMGAVNQARRTGKGAPRLIEQPIRELLAQPFDEVRAKLRIPEPTKYNDCHRIWREEGIDPYDMLASEKAGDEGMAAA